MLDTTQILTILQTSPSIELLSVKNRELIITFLVNTFADPQSAISSENIHTQLTDLLEQREIKNDEEVGIKDFDTYETKAKKYIQNWTNKGFLSNYQDKSGEIFYETSAHTNKTMDWLRSLKKEEYVGTESKFNNILNQLKELVEFSNENPETRLAFLEEKRREIDEQIQKIKKNENIKILKEFEIRPRFVQLTQSARELVSDFKEVENNFKEITKSIYQKYADESATKKEVLHSGFDAWEDLQESPQGKNFEGFWSSISNRTSREEWNDLIRKLYKTLEKNAISVEDDFLKETRKYLALSGEKIHASNKKMTSKLTHIICENENSQSEATKSTIQDIKNSLLQISKMQDQPNIGFEIETHLSINLPFERKLIYEPKKEITYFTKPKLANENISDSLHLKKLFTQTYIDKAQLRERIKNMLKQKSQFTLLEVVEHYGGLEKGLSELLGYISIVKEFQHSIKLEKTQSIVFDAKNRKNIRIPQIIITK